MLLNLVVRPGAPSNVLVPKGMDPKLTLLHPFGHHVGPPALARNVPPESDLSIPC